MIQIHKSFLIFIYAITYYTVTYGTLLAGTAAVCIHSGVRYTAQPRYCMNYAL